MKIKNKKANTVMIVVGIIIAVLSFFIISNFLFGINKTVVTQSDDIACRAFISALDLSKMGTPVFLYKLKKKCKVDTSQTIDLSNKDQSFETIANDLERCFYRYGNGQKDFMSNWDSTGNWCFTCAKVKYKDNDKSIRYNDFVDWTKNNPKNLGKGEKTFYNKINIVYSNKKVSPDLRKEYTEIKKNMKDKSLYPMLSAISDQINYINDMNGKTLDSNDKNLYIVFRYDRLEPTFAQKVSNAKNGAIKYGVIGGLASIAMESVAEGLVFGAVGATVSGPGGIVTGIFGLAVGLVKGIGRTAEFSVEISKKLIKLTKYSQKLISLVKYSSKSVKTTKTLVKIADKASIGERIARIDSDSAAGVKSIGELKKINDLIKAKNVKNYEELVAKIAIKREDIDAIKAVLPEKPLGLQLENLKANEKIYEKYSNLQKNWVKVQKEWKAIKTPTSKEKSLVKDYIKNSPIIIGAMGGAIAVTLINEDYHQYVDVMTPEQYYRLCGPSPVN